MKTKRTAAQKPAFRMPPRRKPKPPSATDPEACVKCGQPGSTCGDCGVVLCYGCNVNPHVAQGHPPKAHLEAMDPELLKPQGRLGAIYQLTKPLALDEYTYREELMLQARLNLLKKTRVPVKDPKKRRERQKQDRKRIKELEKAIMANTPNPNPPQQPAPQPGTAPTTTPNPAPNPSPKG